MKCRYVGGKYMHFMTANNGRLILSQNLSYNDLASAANNMEDTMRACEVAKEKKRKRTMPRSFEGSSSGALPKYRMVYMPSVGQPCQPPQFWGTTHSSRNREQPCHHSRPRQLDIRATIEGKLGTLPRIAASRDWVAHHVLQRLW
jgi:hypothetical protein